MTQTPTAPRHVFRDRKDAGRVLAGLLHRYRGHPDVVVLALPRGGVPVAFEVAQALGAPLDIFTVRKLGVPGREELAMGAIASGGLMVLVDDVVRGLGLSPKVIQEAAEREARELLRRETTYREGRPRIDVTGRTVIVVDDGLATGASMQAAVQALRRLRPAQIVVAVPAAPESTKRELEAVADEVVCASTPTPFFAVGAAYWDFDQTSDDEVRELLREAAVEHPAGRDAPGRPVADPRLRPPGRRGHPHRHGAVRPRRRRAPRAHRRGVPRHARVLRGARPDDATADPGEGVPRGRGRGRLARRLPGQPVRPRPQQGRDGRAGAARVQALPHLDVAQRGRAGLRRLAARAQRRRATTAPRSASTGSTSTACTAPPRRSSPTSSGWTRSRPSGPASATRASTTTPPTRARSSAAARRSAPASSASARWSTSWSS